MKLHFSWLFAISTNDTTSLDDFFVSLPVHLLAWGWLWQVSHTGGFCSVTFCCTSVCHETLSMCCLMSGRSTAWVLLMLIHYFPSHQSLLISWASVHFTHVLAVSTEQNLSIVTKPLRKNNVIIILWLMNFKWPQEKFQHQKENRDTWGLFIHLPLQNVLGYPL